MKKVLFALLLAFPTQVIASPCDQFYPNGKEIVVPGTKVLCNSFYASVYDDDHKANIFSTELAQDRSNKVTRTDDFHADKRLANSPTPADYTNAGYDRGHMTPAADSSTPAQMSDTFLMTNMTPQLPAVNRIAWKGLEEYVRTLPFKWVLTGAHYSAGYKTIGTTKVAVPDFIYKVVYLKDGSVQAFAADNTGTSKAVVQPVAIEQIEKSVGFKLH
jgi:endonuclease G